ncbi:hypothetical protein LCGC14_0443720 [marine sediment metagenome]|uniref:J domain-containing protein n=1 Tax=marine sediment metagenome TaxID=412755 RepID=A0A0F9V6N2_9ZZZZ
MSYRLYSKVSCYETEQDLGVTFGRWGHLEWSVEYNVNSRRRSSEAYSFGVEERAVTVRWRRPDGSPMVLSMADQDRPRDNVRVLYLAIDSIRLNEKRGIDSSVMRAAYIQLAAPSEGDPYAAVGIDPGTAFEDARVTFRRKAKEAHPDTGGSDVEMRTLTVAWRRLCELEGWSG